MKKRIAYLAPELPSLSATFVSSEIWALEDMGVEVKPYSIHTPKAKAYGEKAEALAAKAEIVYEKCVWQLMAALFWLLLFRPGHFWRAFGKLMLDMVKVGGLRPRALKLKFQFLKASWLARDLIRSKQEHLHIHFAHVPTQVGMYAALMAGIPFSFMAHANDIFERPLLIPEKVNRAKHVATISCFNIDLMSSQGGDPEKMHIVRCGVHPTEEAPTKKPLGEKIVIGTLGRLVEKKGVDTLIDAVQLLKNRQIDFRLEIAGDGPLTDELNAQVSQLGLQDDVDFKGAMPHADALQWMQGLDAFVLAGKKDTNGDMDGIPVVLMEAMNFGIPVLSTRLSGIPELVMHEQTGLLSDPENAEQLADNLQRLTQEADLVSSLVHGAKDRLRTEFDQNLNAQRLLDRINA